MSIHNSLQLPLLVVAQHLRLVDVHRKVSHVVVRKLVSHFVAFLHAFEYQPLYPLVYHIGSHDAQLVWVVSLPLLDPVIRVLVHHCVLALLDYAIRHQICAVVHRVYSLAPLNDWHAVFLFLRLRAVILLPKLLSPRQLQRCALVDHLAVDQGGAPSIFRPDDPLSVAVDYRLKMIEGSLVGH